VKRLVLAALAVVSASCGSAYDHVEIYTIGGDFDAVASPAGIRATEGGVVVLEAEPVAQEGHDAYDGLERFELRVADTRIARVRRGVLKDSWVVNGLEVGTTRVQVRVDGELEQLIPLQVAAPK
jgi:hypothetical protein